MAKQNQGDFAFFFLNKCLDVNIKRLYNYHQVEGLARDAKRRKTMTKNQTISAMILNEIANGKSVSEAVDSVLGEGAYQKLAGDIFDALNAR